MKKTPAATTPDNPSLELLFQEHIREYLIKRHGYARLDQRSVSNPDLALIEAELWAFLTSTAQEGLNELIADYRDDAKGQVVRALEEACKRRPLWLILRDGLMVRGRSLRLFYPKPRSPVATDSNNYEKNRWGVVHHYRFGDRREEIDLVLYLNGLPIVTVELKHEAARQDVDDAVRQYGKRDHHEPIFKLPFLYLAADTSKVKMATDPGNPDNFRWLNADLVNKADTAEEFAVEHLYRDVLSPDQLAEAIASFLIYTPNGGTVFPRYHQSRMVRRLTDDILARFRSRGDIGGKYLIQHSAGSGKTLSICWLADRIHSLFDMGDGNKLTDTVFIVTDRRSLDKNIRDEFVNFAHLKDIVGFAKKAEDLRRHLKKNTPIIVSTIQKFAWILDKLQTDSSLRDRKVAFLIDEAHRSQDGKLSEAIKIPFRTDPEIEDTDEEPDDDELADAIRRNDRNQLFVAFTATPSQKTGVLFGNSFDTYTEAQAIAEGYILDVADKIISYKTLYNVAWRARPASGAAKEFPKGIVKKALRTMAYEDMEIIQYKAEEMLTIFERSVAPLIAGKSKAMIVASSRVAGLRYYRTIVRKLAERGADYKALYAFSDFSYREDGADTDTVITETALNGLAPGEAIEDRFSKDEYRILIVANKFQTGFDEPLLAGMFLDKMVADRNAVQTVSRLNRRHPQKEAVIVVDFTNNAEEIIKAFQKYRGENPHQPREPQPRECADLYEEILRIGVVATNDIDLYFTVRNPRGNALAQAVVAAVKAKLKDRFSEPDDRRNHISLMERFLDRYYFLSSVFAFPEPIDRAVLFLEFCVPQLLLRGGQDELNALLKNLYLPKATVQFVGEKRNDGKPRPHGGGGSGGPGGRPPKTSLDEAMADLRELHRISDEEALLIREVTEAKMEDRTVRSEIELNRTNDLFLVGPYKRQMNEGIQKSYVDHGRSGELGDQRYIGPGGIFDFMAVTIIDYHLNAIAG